MGGDVDRARRPLLAGRDALRDGDCGRPPFVGDETRRDHRPAPQHAAGRADLAPARLPAGARGADPAPAGEGPGEAAWLSATEVREALAVDRRQSAPGAGDASTPAEMPQRADPLYRRTFVGREAELRAAAGRLRRRALRPGRRWSWSWASRASARRRSASSSRPTSRCAAARRWSATATKRARSRCPTWPSSRRCAPTCWRASRTACARSSARAPATWRASSRRCATACGRRAARRPATRRTTAGACCRR